LLGLTIGDKLTMRKQDTPPGVPFDSGKDETVRALEGVANTLRNHPEHGATVRHFESIMNMLRELQGGSWAGWDPLTAADAALKLAGDWMPIRKLCMELHQKDVRSPATRNPKAKEGTRRPLTNVERLERQLLQAINYARFAGFKRTESNVAITYIGLNSWRIPQGGKKMEPKPKGRKK
jgi:hypothetical protein